MQKITAFSFKKGKKSIAQNLLQDRMDFKCPNITYFHRVLWTAIQLLEIGKNLLLPVFDKMTGNSTFKTKSSFCFNFQSEKPLYFHPMVTRVFVGSQENASRTHTNTVRMKPSDLQLFPYYMKFLSWVIYLNPAMSVRMPTAPWRLWDGRS